jgi:rieske iron-sulfur protein
MVDAKETTCVCYTPLHERRRVLQVAFGTGLGLLLRHGAMAQDADPHNARPQGGDRFVFTGGERKGTIITPEDLPVGSPPVTAYPMDPNTTVVRDGSRLNEVLLIRLEAPELTEATRTHAVQGLVAYSAICTHTGCDTWMWQGEMQTLKCPCHDSEFDPKDGARVIGGPAPRRLATLPLKVVDGVLMAAGSFVGRVGFQQE